MSGLKHLRNRVKSVKSTQKITKAMHVISAAKLKKLKDQAENINDYSSVLSTIMYDISSSGNLMDLPVDDRKFFSKELEDMPHLLVVMTSERGLCGGFNSNVIKRVKLDIKKLKADGKEVKLLVIGKKGIDGLKNEFSKQIVGYYHVFQGNYEYVAREAKDKIMELIESEKVGACYIYYNKFKNAMTQVMTREQILPVQVITESKISNASEYEGEGLVHNVISLYIGSQINYALIQSCASEEGARMTAMDNATRNAGELIDKLTLQLNRSRQAIITTELTEIISGAESV
jgi:F-type H+-transporting ATPase subunit gamma